MLRKHRSHRKSIDADLIIASRLLLGSTEKLNSCFGRLFLLKMSAAYFSTTLRAGQRVQDGFPAEQKKFQKTTLLFSNSDGSEKKKFLFIGNFLMPGIPKKRTDKVRGL